MIHNLPVHSRLGGFGCLHFGDDVRQLQQVKHFTLADLVTQGIGDLAAGLQALQQEGVAG